MKSTIKSKNSSFGIEMSKIISQTIFIDCDISFFLPSTLFLFYDGYLLFFHKLVANVCR